MSNTITIKDPNGNIVCSVESFTPPTKTLFEVANFKDIRENYWAKDWKYVKDLDNNRILVINNSGVKKVFDFDKRTGTPFVHSVNELEDYQENEVDIDKTIQKIESHYKIQIPSQFRQALAKYNDEFIHSYGHDINCVPLNSDVSKWWMFDEAGNKKYSSGIKDIAYKDFIVVESMGNGDSLLIYKNNELYFYSHDTNEPLTKVAIYKDFNDYLNKVLKPCFGKKDGIVSRLYDKGARTLDDICKKYTIYD